MEPIRVAVGFSGIRERAWASLVEKISLTEPVVELRRRHRPKRNFRVWQAADSPNHFAGNAECG